MTLQNTPSGDGGKIILVTGGTGFLGAYIIKELIEKGHSVRAIRRSSKLPSYISNEILEKVQWVDGDVLDINSLEDAMEGVDTVIHSAAVVSFIKKERKNMYRVNVEGTANVVNVALEKNVRRFIHISSVAALGRTAAGGYVNEEKKWVESKVNTHYAITKFKGELEVWRGFSEGLSGVILNPSTILGYGDWNNSSSAIFKKVFEEFKWSSPGLNGFVGVDDVAKIAVLFATNEITEQRYIVNSDNWHFEKLQSTIADAFGKKRPVRMATPLLMNIARHLEWIKTMITGTKPILTKESVRVANSKTHFENDKILKALPGFSFTPLEETIKKACNLYLGTINAKK
jgi:dihydroflavonol-4-reductase